MPGNFYYVYALKDPQVTPSQIFYIGKGTGSRIDDHLILESGRTRKDIRIKEIRNAGMEPEQAILCNELAEHEALRIEAELISTLGTEATGGLLTNSVIPSTNIEESSNKVVIPEGSVEKAQVGYKLLKDAIIDLIRSNPKGITNSDAAGALGLRTDHLGGQRLYLTYSVLGMLLKEGNIVKDGHMYIFDEKV